MGNNVARAIVIAALYLAAQLAALHWLTDGLFALP